MTLALASISATCCTYALLTGWLTWKSSRKAEKKFIRTLDTEGAGSCPCLIASSPNDKYQKLLKLLFLCKIPIPGLAADAIELSCLYLSEYFSWTQLPGTFKSKHSIWHVVFIATRGHLFIATHPFVSKEKRWERGKWRLDWVNSSFGKKEGKWEKWRLD